MSQGAQGHLEKQDLLSHHKRKGGSSWVDGRSWTPLTETNGWKSSR